VGHRLAHFEAIVNIKRRFVGKSSTYREVSLVSLSVLAAFHDWPQLSRTAGRTNFEPSQILVRQITNMAGAGHRLPGAIRVYFQKIGQKQSDFDGTSRNAMQITRATDYAVRIMVYMATLPHERRVPLSELAEASGAPESFVSKVLQRLALRGMVTSNRGRGGGFQLAVDAEETSLLQVVEAIEGPLQINLCLPGELTCDRKSWCAVHPVWNEAQAALKQVLASVSIARMSRESTANLAAAGNSQETPDAEAEFVQLPEPKRWPD